MIQICYSLDEAIEISGTQKELGKLRQDLLSFLETDLEILKLKAADNINPEPWDFTGKSLIFSQNSGATKVSIDGENIKIEGSKNNLENLSSFLYFEENTPSGFHSHYEYFEGSDEYISSDSFPLIIQIK